MGRVVVGAGEVEFLFPLFGGSGGFARGVAVGWSRWQDDWRWCVRGVVNSPRSSKGFRGDTAKTTAPPPSPSSRRPDFFHSHRLGRTRRPPSPAVRETPALNAAPAPLLRSTFLNPHRAGVVVPAGDLEVAVVVWVVPDTAVAAAAAAVGPGHWRRCLEAGVERLCRAMVHERGVIYNVGDSSGKRGVSQPFVVVPLERRVSKQANDQGHDVVHRIWTQGLVFFRAFA